MGLDVRLLHEQVRAALADPTTSLRFAAAGWQDALLYDSAFMGRLEPTPTRAGGPSAPPPTETDTPGHILSALAEIDNTVDCLATLRQLATGEQAALRVGDASTDAHGSAVIVVGAGPVGLLTALLAKRSLPDTATVTLVENRCEPAGVKQPYTRDWLTHLEFDLLTPLVPSDVMALVHRLSDARCGLPIHLIETLLLLAVRRAGVVCLFCEPADLDAAILASAALVFDTSGGHWTEPTPTSAATAPEQVSYAPERQHGAAFVQSGYPSALDHGPLSVPLALEGPFAHPLVKGRPLQVAMAKITGISARYHRQLFQAVVPINADHKFYIWHGNLAPAVNDVLVIVKLTRAEQRALNAAFDLANTPLPVASVSRTPGLSQRLSQLLHQVDAVCRGNSSPRMQPPFVYAPRWLAVPQCDFQWQSVPVVKLGDSVFGGNPVSGNGLTGHLQQLLQLHHALSTSAVEADLDSAAA